MKTTLHELRKHVAVLLREGLKEDLYAEFPNNHKDVDMFWGAHFPPDALWWVIKQRSMIEQGKERWNAEDLARAWIEKKDNSELQNIRSYPDITSLKAALKANKNQTKISLKSQAFTAYHTSPNPLKELKSGRGMWFTLDRENAGHYHKGTGLGTNQPVSYTFHVEITGKFFNEKELAIVCDNLDIDFADFVADLVTNPTDPSNHKDVITIKNATGCDGVFHWDYHPADNSDNALSLFVIDPASCVRIIEDISSTIT